jgi:hypothetical protein
MSNHRCARCLELGLDPVVRIPSERYEERVELRRSDRSKSLGSFTVRDLCKTHAEERDAELNEQYPSNVRRARLAPAPQGLPL